MDILNDIDAYRAAMAKCHLSESCMPMVKGRLVEDVETWNKVQHILDCVEMEDCHKWLYGLDVDNLTDDEVAKVNKLYDLAIEKGFIVVDTAEPESETSDDNAYLAGGSTTEQATAEQSGVATQKTFTTAPKETVKEKPTSAFICLYSAMKNGEIKTGEFYSNSIDPRSAKADCIANLSKNGYANIKIMAIEAGDPYCAGCDDTYETDDAAIGADSTVAAEDEKCPVCGNSPCTCEADGDEEKKEDVTEGDDEDKKEEKVDEATVQANGKYKVWKVEYTYNGQKAEAFLVADNEDECREQLKPFELEKIVKVGMMDKDEYENGVEECDKSDAEEVKESKKPISAKQFFAESEEDDDDVKVEESDDEEKKDDTEKVEEDDGEPEDVSVLEDDDKKKKKVIGMPVERPEDEGGEVDGGDAGGCCEDEEEKKDDDKDDKKDNAEGKELTPEQKSELKAEYTKAFRATMLKIKQEKCIRDMSESEKAKFYTEFAKVWTKNPASEFLDAKEQASFQTMEVKQ